MKPITAQHARIVNELNTAKALLEQNPTPQMTDDYLKMLNEVGALCSQRAQEMMSAEIWEDAPAWAAYAAMDVDGYWHYFQCKPHPGPGYWVLSAALPASSRRYERITSLNPIDTAHWKETLLVRPPSTKVPK